MLQLLAATSREEIPVVGWIASIVIPLVLVLVVLTAKRLMVVLLSSQNASIEMLALSPSSTRASVSTDNDLGEMLEL